MGCVEEVHAALQDLLPGVRMPEAAQQVPKGRARAGQRGGSCRLAILQIKDDHLHAKAPVGETADRGVPSTVSDIRPCTYIDNILRLPCLTGTWLGTTVCGLERPKPQA